MKDADTFEAAFELEEARPFHAPKQAQDRRVAIDLVAILDPFEDTGPDKISDHQARDIWLGRSLPRAFKHARVLTYRRTRSTGLGPGSEVDTQALVLRFLTLLSGIRQQTSTTDTPFIMLLHNSSGVNMLSKLAFCLLSGLGHAAFLGLATNARGIICMEANQCEPNLPYRITPLQSRDPSGSTSFNDSLGNSLPQHSIRLPITVFLDDKLQLEPSQEPRLNPYIWNFFEPHARSASSVFTHLDGSPYPSSSASTGRVLGEIRKFLSQYIEPSFAGVEGAHFRRWLFPSKALFQHQAPQVVNGSCNWLFRHENYRSWMSSDQSDPVLWITGKPGSGKSTLMQGLINSIRHENALHLQEPAIAASVMFDFRYVLEPEKGGAKGPFLRALLYQMLESDPSLVSRLCQALSPLLPLPERPEDLDVRSYQLYFDKALSMVTDRAKVFFLIDGLDECDADVQDDVMACLAPIYQQSRYTKKVRIMITSRWGSSVQRIQRRCQTGIRWMEMENTQDIATFCSAMLSRRQTSRGIITEDQTACVHWKDSIETLVHSIIARADGVFLWASLVVDLLLNNFPAQQHPDCGTKRWQQAVQELPTGLDLLYKNLVSRIPTQLKSTSDLLFMWCSHTFRPLEEVEIHSLFRLNDVKLNLESVWPDFPTCDVGAQLRRMTYGLIEVVHDAGSNTRIVRFIHATVRDFFVKASPLSVVCDANSSPDAVGLAHTIMAKTCLRCIKQAFDDAESTTDPLFKYSVSYWGCHAKAGEQLSVSQAYITEVSQWSASEIASLWLEGHEQIRSPQIQSKGDTSLLHVVAYNGLFSAMEAISSENLLKASWDSKDYLGRTALHLAVAQGHTHVVRLLVERGACIDVEDTQKTTPLQCAAYNGHASVVTALLAEGADMTLRDTSGSTAVHHAARAGHTNVLKLLIAGGADLETMDSHGHSVLTLAAASGEEDLADFLLKLHNITWSRTVVGVALTLAAGLGLKALSRSLLQSDVFSGPDDIFVQQAFIATIIGGSEEVLLLFLAYGCHPNVHDYRHGQSALSIAAAGGDDRIVQILLDHNAHPNLRDVRTGITPVMHAISRGFPVIVQLLLGSGAQLEIPETSDNHAKDGWIHKIVLALIHECGSGKNERGDGKKSAASSNESVAGSSTQGRKAQPSSNESCKRSRPKHETDGNRDEEGSDDERLTGKRPRNSKDGDAQMMCPFQKRYPDQHRCPPYFTVSRLKEHIHRTHRKVFCVHCWKIFSNDEKVTVHHKTALLECVKRVRTDFSGGICEEQAIALKSRRGIQGISEEAHWGRVFRIVFPDYEDPLPPATYYYTSSSIIEAVERILGNRCFQQRLVPMLRGGDQLTVVNDLILAFANNERVNQSIEPALETRPSGDHNSLFDSSMFAAQPPTHNVGIQELQSMPRNFPLQHSNSQLWGQADMTPLPFNVPDLQHPLSRPNFTHAHSDSGVGSMLREPQGRELNIFDNMGVGSAGDVEVTASPGDFGQAQAQPYFHSSMQTMYASSDSRWDTGEDQSWAPSNGESTSEEFQKLQ